MYIHRPYKLRRGQFENLLQNMRNYTIQLKENPYLDENDLTDEDFNVFCPVSKEQFLDMFTYCDPVGRDRREISKKDLLAFLCKTRQGISDEFLKVIFKYPTRQCASNKIALVRKSLQARFVPENIGLQALTRDEYMQRHVTDFANHLLNPQPEIPRVIVLNDCTYLYIEKSSCFKVLRQSYSVHKGRHLIKPSMLVAPDGYILDIQGPYFSNTANNDAQILINEFQRDVETMRAWFHDGDIFVVDRGYRDAIPMLERLGIQSKMPEIMQPGRCILYI
uniref:DDE Tnp4 domain-containing protein n=1 Tax=Cacopsylla melanoneura TaxID=428564 RepID=A0A8D8TA77_9HEMI